MDIMESLKLFMKPMELLTYASFSKDRGACSDSASDSANILKTNDNDNSI